MRNPKRTASTAMALVIGLTMVADGLGLRGVAQGVVLRRAVNSTNADLYVLTPEQQSPGYSPEVIDIVRDVEGVDAVSPTSIGMARSTAEAALHLDRPCHGRGLELGMVEGEAEDLTDDGVLV